MDTSAIASQQQLPQPGANHANPPPSSSMNVAKSNGAPMRSLTVSSPHDLNRSRLNQDQVVHARSEDLNHTNHIQSGAQPPRDAPSPAFLSASRPITPAGARSGASSPNHSDAATSDRDNRRTSTGSLSYAQSSDSRPSTSTAVSSSPSGPSFCASCGLQLEGPFVRALNNVWHLQCFKCKDCDAVVATKFFPIEGPDGKQQPLCERDYFRRLGLICGQCDQALRGSYITACNKKYHVEHFTCSVCPTLFGPQDSYYEHETDVYCHFHYSTRFATKCAGCNCAILKQFVEINRNGRDECWHPECYMINKFWNVKVVSRRPTSSANSDATADEPAWMAEENTETATSLKEKQVKMEQQVYRIWTVLSAFEESSAACISDMLRHVSNGQYAEAVRMAEKFILHVEVLFATIDDLETHFARLSLRGMSHVREARMLCRKTVELFTLLSHPPESGTRRIGVTQDLLALVTGLAHYLKILIRIALTGALKLERDHGVREAMTSFLDKLHLLSVEGGNPEARRLIRGGEQQVGYGVSTGTQGVTYGFRSLAPEFAGESPFSVSASTSGPSATSVSRQSNSPPSDLCVKCSTTVEEDCVRFGTYQRWHSFCLQCQTCGKASAPPPPKDPPRTADQQEVQPPKISTARRPPADTEYFVYEPETAKDSPYGEIPKVVYCVDHGHDGCRGGFQPVTRLEQYAFLLNIALRRLYYLLRKNKLIAPASSHPSQDRAPPNTYRESSDINTLKSVHLDRKISATAQIPKRSTVVESPSGKVAQPTDNLHNVRVHEQSGLGAQRSQVQGLQAQGSTAPSRTTRPAAPQAQPQASSQMQTSRTPQTQPPKLRLPMTESMGMPSDDRGRLIRPQFARNNTGVKIVDESAPNSPTTLTEEPLRPRSADGITLADIPQIIEVEQARVQHRPLHQSNTPWIAELTPLQLLIIKHAAVLALYRSPLKSEMDLDEIMDFVENKKERFWNKLLFKAGKPKKGVFGVPLEILVEREGADSMLGASRATLRVPSFIDDVISAMRQMDMSVEGIFRKNGNIRRLNDLTEAIDRDPASVDLTQDNPVQLAALLKKFLKLLPEPLMTFKLYRLFMAAENMTNEDDRKRHLHLVTLLLPKGNRDTMEVLFFFLKWVASFAHVDEETGNKMDLHNLATVISPNIFRSVASKGTNDAVRVESFESIRVMDTLLDHQDEIYTVPEEFMGLLRDQEYFAGCLDLPSKDIIKKVDTYVKAKASNRAPVLSSPTQVVGPFGSAASGGFSVGSKESDARLASQKSDPTLTRGRAEGYRALSAAGQSNIERPQMQTAFSDNQIWNGQSPQSRQQSPHGRFMPNGQSHSRQQSPQARLPHQPFSHPIGSSPTSLSLGAAAAAVSPTPLSPNPPAQDDWVALQRSPQLPSSLPGSRPLSFIRKNSKDNASPPVGGQPSAT